MNTSKRLIIRLSRYKNSLSRLKSLGFIKVFSDNIADAVGVTPSQVRKDFSIFGIPGNKRGGYLIDDLIRELKRILCKNNINNVVVVGCGNLGNALMKYERFIMEGIKIVAGFDNNDKKLNEKLSIPIYHLDKLQEYIKKNKIEIAIIAVPDSAALSVTDLLVSAGIKGLLNFSSLRLRGGEDTIIHNINLQTELESLVYFVNAAKKNRRQ
ncbi:MAG: redox-sensing transcriptional repressor Rex [Spirochaetes bacterium]|nr:redox-sensing transcriptional repressor Rex [Spirochaetota bacterium]